IVCMNRAQLNEPLFISSLKYTASRTTRSDEDRDMGWDAWGPWSDCSRTCGGGASYSLRRCLNGESCEGKNIRYRTCSNSDCPVDSGDFRAQQCSAHNDIKYQGATYEWIPGPYDPLAPCALQCQAKDRSLTVELAPKVLDGTRCREDAFDMCINGVCQEVGCDRQLDSGAKEDNCGVCDGDGSTCQLVRGQALIYFSTFSLSAALNTILEVPVGSRFLRLSAKGPDFIVIEAVSLQGRREETSLMSTGSYVIGNTSLDFQRGTDRQTLRTSGPLHSDYIVKYGGPKDTVVQFLFYQPIRYQWRETDFFPCSVTCGGGYQLNSAECYDIRSNQTLPEHHCKSYPENTKPTPKLKECNMDPCKDGWEQGPWTQCSVSCGGGWQERSVMCVEEDSQGQFSQVEEWKCTHSPQPVTRQTCNTFSCPQWVAMEWSQCTVTCGRGLRYRVVLCIDHRGQHIGGCETSLKPHVKEDCLVPVACHKPRESLPVEAKFPWLKQAQELEEHHTATEEPTFVPGPWSPCSTTCGVGRQTREVKCQVLLSFTQTEVDLPEEECGKDKPLLERLCNQGPCNQLPGSSLDLQDHLVPFSDVEELFIWDYRGFTSCSVSCAGGKQTAIVRCVNQKTGEEVEDSLCDSSNRPLIMIRICNPEPCPPSWEVTAWTSCSASCGVGIQTRSVFCMRSLSIEQQDILSVPEEECREFKPAILQPCNQVDCPPAWETEPWQLCSQTCGGGVQLRKVYCKQLLSTGAYRRLGDGTCSGPKPAVSRSCSNSDCLPSWAGGEWGKCSVTCGLGIQRREQLCRQLTSDGQQMTLDKGVCSGLPSPPLVRTCRMIACPSKKHTLIAAHHIYIQTQKKKRFHLTIGGHAYLLPNTSLIIKCPVRRFPKMFIRWIKDGRPVASSKHLTITKSGSLKIPFVSADDVGVYRCVAGPAYEIFTLQLIGSENQSTGRRLPSTPRSTWEERKPTCYTHNIHLDGVSVSLLPPSGHNVSLQPRLREKLINITLDSCFTWCLMSFSTTDSLHNWSELVSALGGAAVHRPRIIRQQQKRTMSVQESVDVNIGDSALLTNTTQSLTIRCPAEGFPPPVISWSKDGAPLKTRPLDSGVVSLPSGSLRIKNVSPQNQGVYSCTATNAAGKSTVSTDLQVYMVPDHKQSVYWDYNNQTLKEVSRPTHIQGPGLGPQYKMLVGGRVLEVYTLRVNFSGRYQCQTFINSTRETLLAWIYEHSNDWTTCSASCGNRGTWLRRLDCVTPDGKIVPTTKCQHIQKPVTSAVPCNRQDCPPRWLVSDWSKCSTSCGSGWKQRQVSCQQLDARGAEKNLTAASCERMSRPADTEQCSANNCPSWVISPWGKCSGRCLGPTTTVQRRSVTCQHTNGSLYTDCDIRHRPVSLRNCSSDLCDVEWRSGSWRACTVVCGSGFQSRRVDCIHRGSGRTLADQHCAWLHRPSTWQHCNTISCGNECKDTTQYCGVVKRLKLCHLDTYKHRCCESCTRDAVAT
uniref:ADAMTS-like 3 n=1 Tax=Cynoglossus semilaevis TaxID=244447 RepID=A0A3P8VIL7_CYNSE